MLKSRQLRDLALAAAIAFAGASGAVAQDGYPTKPIRIIVPSAAGGASDLTARRMSEKMSEFLGQRVIVENRPGAGTSTGIKYVIDSEPDGYTLISPSSTLNMIPFTMKDVGISPLEDLEPIGVATRQGNVISVGGSQPFTTLTELIDAAKAAPGTLLYAHGGPGSPQNVTVQMFMEATGTDLTGVQYQGAGASMLDVVAGRVTMISSGYLGQAGFISSGEFRPLAVTTSERIPPLPDVPTLKELGIDVETSTWLGLLAPVGTPETAIAKLSEALKFALDDPKTREEIISEGGDPTFLRPDEFRALLEAEAARFAEIAQRIGIVPQ